MPVSVRNMIPNSMSNETQRDAEPNITATFLDPTKIAASPFTPDPMGSGSAPIYISTDGGNTWTLNVCLPGGDKTGDTTLRFVGPSNVLYAGILRTDNSDLVILRKANFTAAGMMTALLTKTNDDQPYVEGATVMAGSGTETTACTSARTTSAPHRVTPRRSTSRSTRPPRRRRPGSAPIRSRRARRPGQDGPPIRPAVHLDGTVYGVYMGWRSATTTDVVVVRDDNWGAGATPFTALVDSDMLAGKRVVTGVSRCTFGTTLGTQRVGAGSCAIAVDPRNSSIVYIAWQDGTTGANQTLHVRRSTNRGVTWSATDVRTIANATNGCSRDQHARPGGVPLPAAAQSRLREQVEHPVRELGRCPRLADQRVAGGRPGRERLLRRRELDRRLRRAGRGRQELLRDLLRQQHAGQRQLPERRHVPAQRQLHHARAQGPRQQPGGGLDRPVLRQGDDGRGVRRLLRPGLDRQPRQRRQRRRAVDASGLLRQQRRLEPPGHAARGLRQRPAGERERGQRRGQHRRQLGLCPDPPQGRRRLGDAERQRPLPGVEVRRRQRVRRLELDGPARDVRRSRPRRRLQRRRRRSADRTAP